MRGALKERTNNDTGEHRHGLKQYSGKHGNFKEPDDHDTAEQGGRALRHLYDMRPEAAALAIDSLKTAHPGHPIGHFLDGLVVWWDIPPVLSELSRIHLSPPRRTTPRSSRGHPLH